MSLAALLFSLAGTVFALLITIIGFFIKRTLDKIEEDICMMNKNTSDFKSFASRVDTVLAYHDREISDIYRMIEKDRKVSSV